MYSKLDAYLKLMLIGYLYYFYIHICNSYDVIWLGQWPVFICYLLSGNVVQSVVWSGCVSLSGKSSTWFSVFMSVVF